MKNEAPPSLLSPLVTIFLTFLAHYTDDVIVNWSLSEIIFRQLNTSLSAILTALYITQLPFKRQNKTWCFTVPLIESVLILHFCDVWVENLNTLFTGFIDIFSTLYYALRTCNKIISLYMSIYWTDFF